MPIQSAAEVHITRHGTVVLTDQSPEGGSVMMAILAGLSAGVPPLKSEIEHARYERRNGVSLYGEKCMLECEAAGYANPFAKRFDNRMSAAEQQAADEARAERLAA